MQLIKLLIFIFMLPILTGCSGGTEDIISPINFYYLAEDITYENPTGVLMAEIREGEGHEGDYIYLMQQYLEGPQSEACISPFPHGLTLKSLHILKEKVSITLSPQIADLNGHKLTLACSCIAKTIMEMAGVDAVTISAEGTTINGEPSVTMTKNDFILTDNNEYIPINTQ